MSDRTLAQGSRGRVHLGIKHKLYLAFGLVASLTIAAAGFSWVLFDRAGTTIDALTGTNIPEIANSLQLARVSAEIAAVTPALAASPTDADREQTFQALQAKQAALRELFSHLEETRADDRTTQLRRFTEDMAQRLTALNGLVKARLTLAAARAKTVDGLRAAGDNFGQFAASLVDDTRSNLTLGLQSASDQGSGADVVKALSGLADNEVMSLHTTLTLAADMNTAQGLLLQAATASRSDLTALGENLEAAVQRVNIGLDAVDRIAPNPTLRQLATAVLAFGDGPNGLLEQRTRELDARDAAQATLAQCRDLVRQLSEQVAAIVDSARADSAAARERSAAQVRGGKLLILGLAAASLVIALLLAWLYVGRSVIARLIRLGTAMRAVADGKLDTPVAVEGADEITAMASALVVFRDNAVEAKAASAQRAADRERVTAARREEMNALAGGFEASVKSVVTEVASGSTTMRSAATALTETAAKARTRTAAVASAADHASTNVETVAAAAEQLAASSAEIGR
jgi:phosphoglycerate-specific signal transduction histidine kinase